MRTIADGDVTGAGTEVEIVVDLAVDDVWKLITEVSRIGEWSPECVFAAWQPSDWELPHVGARFDAHNEYADGYKSAVVCVVTDVVRPSVFEWVVLDDDLDVARPGSIWRYELEPAAERRGTVIRHRFTHGAGETGLREFARRRPDRAEAALIGRLAELREHMRATLVAMTKVEGTSR